MPRSSTRSKSGFKVEKAPEATTLPPPDKVEPAGILENREPVCPGVPPQTGKGRFIPAELWVICRALAEGRRLAIAGISVLTGISEETLIDRSVKDKWLTPSRVKKENLRQIDKVISSVFEGVVDFVSENSEGEEEEADADEVDQDGIDMTEMGGPTDLRNYIETPAKFRPKDHELLAPIPLSANDKMALLERARADIRGDIGKRADAHVMTVTEISQIATAHLLSKMQDDPALGLLMADKLEKLDKVARRNLGLEQKDNIKTVSNVLILSDPTFIPKPAIMSEEEEDGPALPGGTFIEGEFLVEEN